MDTLTKARRSWNMSRIRGKATKPELAVRRIVRSLGFRIRTNVKALPGSPDIVIPALKLVIFVHGCFWHRHPRCPLAYTPKTRRQWWIKKLTANRTRDRKHLRDLARLGWSAVISWECEQKRSPNLALTLATQIGARAMPTMDPKRPLNALTATMLPAHPNAAECIAFLRRCVRDIGPGFHPDTPSVTYFDAHGVRTFTQRQARYLDTSIHRAMLRLVALSKDPYEICLAAWHQYNQLPPRSRD